VAGGTAVGVFWGFSPLPGMQMILAAITATILKVNRLPAILAVHISNPLTAILIYPVTWAVGDLLLRPFCGATHLAWGRMSFTFHGFFHLAGQAMVRMLIGGFVVGAICAAITYFRIFRAVVRYRRSMPAAGLPGIESARTAQGKGLSTD